MALRALAHAGGRVAKRSATRAGRHAVELTTATHGVRGKRQNRTHALVGATACSQRLGTQHCFVGAVTIPLCWRACCVRSTTRIRVRFDTALILSSHVQSAIREIFGLDVSGTIGRDQLVVTDLARWCHPRQAQEHCTRSRSNTRGLRLLLVLALRWLGVRLGGHVRACAVNARTCNTQREGGKKFHSGTSAQKIIRSHKNTQNPRLPLLVVIIGLPEGIHECKAKQHASIVVV
jgi:hypothetical protein